MINFSFANEYFSCSEFIFVFAFTNRNNVFVEFFFLNSFVIKDIYMKCIFYKGQNNGGLHTLHLQLSSNWPEVNYVEFSTWHAWLECANSQLDCQVLSINSMCSCLLRYKLNSFLCSCLINHVSNSFLCLCLLKNVSNSFLWLCLLKHIFNFTFFVHA